MILLHGSCDSLGSRNDPALWGRLTAREPSSHLISEPLMVQMNSYKPDVIGADWPIAAGLGQQVCGVYNGHLSAALTWQLAATIDWARNITFPDVTFRFGHMFNSCLTNWREKHRAAVRRIIHLIKTKIWGLGRCKRHRHRHTAWSLRSPADKKRVATKKQGDSCLCAHFIVFFCLSDHVRNPLWHHKGIWHYFFFHRAWKKK